MMKKSLMLIMIVLLSLSLISCGGKEVKTVEEVPVVEEETLPESVMRQVRKDAKESKGWEKFDQSGKVKFLQVQHTAPASVPMLDGSYGERLIEVKAESAIEGHKMEWTLENDGPLAVWLIATSDEVLELPVKIDPESSVSVETTIEDGYSYIVVDNVGGMETTLNVKARYGDTEAKTVRGKDIKVVWF